MDSQKPQIREWKATDSAGRPFKSEKEWTLEELLDFITEDGYTLLTVLPVPGCGIMTLNSRIAEFALNAVIFGAGGMPARTFAESLVNAYRLSGMTAVKNGCTGGNAFEGWKISVLGNKFHTFVQVAVTDIVIFNQAGQGSGKFLPSPPRRARSAVF
ncbi:MAG: hypothetical protein LBT65_04755 [Synergistaceae bacterium]|jgi:hypothetical protein|nr:hypothetical protein [Synergistaceae bacterium]